MKHIITIVGKCQVSVTSCSTSAHYGGNSAHCSNNQGNINMNFSYLEAASKYAVKFHHKIEQEVNANLYATANEIVIKDNPAFASYAQVFDKLRRLPEYIEWAASKPNNVITVTGKVTVTVSNGITNSSRVVRVFDTQSKADLEALETYVKQHQPVHSPGIQSLRMVQS